MPYNASQDLTLKAWELEDLQFAVRKYGEDGARKFQIGPRLIARPGREPIWAKVGRLDLKETQFLHKILPEALKLMRGEKK